MTGPLELTTPADWESISQWAHYNPFLFPVEDILIDLLTGSGTSTGINRPRSG